jgi:threonine/homoserine/homoserine lactone efflux protein
MAASPFMVAALMPRVLSLLGEVAGTHPMLLAVLGGFFCALIFACIPVGPINLTILNEGAQRGFVWALCIGLGAAMMDAVYCAISFTGLSQFFDHGFVQAFMQVMSFVFLLFLGSKFLLAQSVKVPTKLDAASEKLGARIEGKIHPHSAFATGFVRVLANLGVLVAWVVLSANLMAQNVVAEGFAPRAACVAGVFTGTATWFLILSFCVSRGHGKFGEKTLLRLQHISGICLIATAFLEGANIAWNLARHKIGP